MEYTTCRVENIVTKEKLLIISNFSFRHNVLKSCLLHWIRKASLCGEVIGRINVIIHHTSFAEVYKLYLNQKLKIEKNPFRWLFFLYILIVHNFKIFSWKKLLFQNNLFRNLSYWPSYQYCWSHGEKTWLPSRQISFNCMPVEYILKKSTPDTSLQQFKMMS